MKLTSTSYLDEDVFKKQVELLYRQIPIVLVPVIIISSSLAAIFYSKGNPQHILNYEGELNYTLIWLFSVYLISFIRFYYFLQWKKAASSISFKRFAEIGINLSFISGIQWAVSIAIFFHPESTIDVAVLIVIMLGMISGAVGSLSIIPAAFVAFTAPISIYMLYTLLNSGNTDFHVFAYMYIVFIIASSFFSRNTYKSNMYGIKLSIENVALIENLQAEKEKAESANIAKSNFLAAASHDLRQPLQSMTLFTEALKENLKDAENIDLANRITNSHDALRELLNALLDISKLDAGSVEINNIPFDISQVTNELYSQFQPIASQKNQQLAISKSSCFVFSDPILTKRILQNLIANATNHSPEDSIIIIETKIQDDFLLINVKDNGPGIPKEEQNHIFQEFYQLHNPERDRNKGLGLGLAIVKRLSILLNSEIELESSINAGCCFLFRLPLASPEQIATKEVTSKIQNFTSLADMKILLVEDEIDVREALAVVLNRWGCTVWQVDNVKDAIALIKNKNINFIITDYRLRKHETGIELLKEVNRIDPSISGLMITGDTATEQIQEFLQAGHTVLHKPIKPAELRMAIQQTYAKALKKSN
ncbi:MAG: ATP-binding protein [Woeseiaceae bacterium]